MDGGATRSAGTLTGAGGFHNATNVGLDIAAPLRRPRFYEIIQKGGLGAALTWRAAQFEE